MKSPLYEKYAALQEDDLVKFSFFDAGVYKVVSNLVDDVVFVQPVDESDTGFHIFYDEMDVDCDDFEPVDRLD